MNKKDNILNAALKLFVEQGEQTTSMKWIAKEAKCGIGTMYNYFPSKNDLISALYLKLKTNLFNNIRNALDLNAPVKQQFITTWLSILNYSITHQYEFKFLNIFSHSPKISEEASDKINKLLYPIMETYEKGKNEGVIKDIDTIQLIIFINGAITATILNNPTVSEEEKKKLVLMAWDAIKS